MILGHDSEGAESSTHEGTRESMIESARASRMHGKVMLFVDLVSLQ